jgi:hypothetical protein
VARFYCCTYRQLELVSSGSFATGNIRATIGRD